MELRINGVRINRSQPVMCRSTFTIPTLRPMQISLGSIHYRYRSWFFSLTKQTIVLAAVFMNTIVCYTFGSKIWFFILYLIFTGTQNVFVKTWGCSHNNSDSEYMAGQLASFGYNITGRYRRKPLKTILWSTFSLLVCLATCSILVVTNVLEPRLKDFLSPRQNHSLTTNLVTTSTRLQWDDFYRPQTKFGAR